jgi:hypothetical protein
LVELKEDSEGTRQPVEYISNGDYDVINWDEFNGVSYWRLRDEITSDRTEERKYKAGARNNIETTVPLKLVFAVPRTKLTEDDAYSFDRIRQTMVKQFAIDDDVIKTTLQAESVRINVVNANSDAKDVWEDETGGTGTFEPKYETVFGSIDVDVVIISKHSCLPTECDDVEIDILRSFDWCGNTAVTVGRLTEAQQTCISDFLCSCADATVQLNGSTIGTVASGDTDSFPVLQDGSPVGSWNGSAWIIPSCPATLEVSVALDDTTPEYDQTVQITATATGATSYTFYLPTRDGYETVTQASNVYSWTCRAVGAFTVKVEATDGSSTGIGEESGTQSGDVNASAIISAHNTVTGDTMGAVQQAAVLNAVLRLKGAIGNFNVRLWETAISQGWEWLPYIPIDDSTTNALAYSIEFFDPSTTVTLNNFVSGDFSVDGLVGGAGKFIEMKHAPNDYPQNDAFGFAYINTYNSGGLAFGSTDLADPLGNPSNSFMFQNLQFGQTRGAVNDIRRSQINATNETGANDTEGLCGVWRLQPYYTQGMIGCALRETEGTSPNSTTPATNNLYGHASNSSGGVTRESSDRICAIITGQANNLETMAQVKYVVETFQEEIVTGGRGV